MKTFAHLIKKLIPLYRFASIICLLVFVCVQTGYAQNCFIATLNSDITTVCKGGNITFSGSITNNGADTCAHYTVELWKTSGIAAFETFLLNQTDNYSYQYNTNGDGADFSVFAKIIGQDCDTDCNSMVQTQTIAIDLIPISAQIFPANPIIACGNNNVTLTATNPLDPMGDYTYTWKGPSTPNFSGPELNASIPGTYSVTITHNVVSTCSATTSVSVTNNSQLNVTITTVPSNGTFCEGASISLSASAGTNYQYVWSTGTIQQSINVNTTGTYSVTVTMANSTCSGTKTSAVTELSKPNLGAHANAYFVKTGGSRTISFNPPSGIAVDWLLLDVVNVPSLTKTTGTGSFTENYTSDDLRAPGLVRYRAQAKYISGQGCPGEIDTILVTVIPETTEAPFIPEVVSPNNDGSNDFWNVLFPNDDAGNYRVLVYNRSGGKVYEKDSMIEAWSPSGCPDGVYYYLITHKDGGQQYKGALTIIGGNQ